jgi:hypothetical protein
VDADTFGHCLLVGALKCLFVVLDAVVVFFWGGSVGLAAEDIGSAESATDGFDG